MEQIAQVAFSPILGKGRRTQRGRAPRAIEVLLVTARATSTIGFATAIGLVAAIPAAGAYNILSGQVQRYAAQLEAFAGEFITILSRQLEEQV